MYEQQVTLVDAAADTRTASRSQHKPTHALGHSLYIGIQLCRPRAAKSVRACVTVRPVRVSAAGGAGAAGAAHTTNSVRHMLLAVFETGLQPSLLRPTPASFCIVFLSGIRKRKNVFQVTQYKTCQILVQTFPEPWVWGSPSVFHFRNRKRFQVPGFEWVHELWLFCLASNPAQFCAEISCGKTGLGHIFKLSDSRFQKEN